MRTRDPPGWAVASAVGIWASTVVSPRSTVSRLTAPRKETATTVPESGPLDILAAGARDTASGRTRAHTGRPPRTPAPPRVTTPARRLVSPTNSATKGVAGWE